MWAKRVTEILSGQTNKEEQPPADFTNIYHENQHMLSETYSRYTQILTHKHSLHIKILVQ